MTKKILFIVQGEGRGHLSQALAVKQWLGDKGFEIAAVLVGSSKQRKLPAYFIEKIGADIFSFQSPNLVADKSGKGIKAYVTIWKSLLQIPTFLRSIRYILRNVKKHNADLIINFYEPLAGLAFLLSKPKVPVLCVAHQYMHLHPEYKFPKGKMFYRFGLKLVTRITSFNSTLKLGLSLYPAKNIPAKKLYIIPPILREDVLKLTPTNEGHLLVYVLNKGYSDEVMNWAKHHPEEVIHCFSDFTEEKRINNVFQHPLNDELFLNLMASAKCVAMTAGFESLAEAIYIGKPVMIVPVKNHLEQETNALDALNHGLAIVSENFNLSLVLTNWQGEKEVKDLKEWFETTKRNFISQVKNLLKDG